MNFMMIMCEVQKQRERERAINLVLAEIVLFCENFLRARVTCERKIEMNVVVVVLGKLFGTLWVSNASDIFKLPSSS